MLDTTVTYLNNYSQGFTSEQSSRSASVTPNSEHEATKETKEKQVRTLPGQKETGPDGRQRDSLELSREAEEIRNLQVRDREVRAHEAAHAAAGGAYAGSPSYTFERGPDGGVYAVGGEVGIDVSPIPGDPQATMQKAQQVRAAALAPAEPSAQDMRVAQRAQAMAAKARAELSKEMSEGLKSVGDKALKPDAEGESVSNSKEIPTNSGTAGGSFSGGRTRLSIQA